jgi:hypothetical protein
MIVMSQYQSLEEALSHVCTNDMINEAMAIDAEINRISPNFVCDARAILSGSIPTVKEQKQAINTLGRDNVLIRTNLNVPYSEKDEAKFLGAKWCPLSKTWYCLGDTSKFSQWLNTVTKKAKSKPSRYKSGNNRRYK